MKEKIKGLIPYIIILVVVLLIRSFIATPVRVNGESMDDTLKDGDILILNKMDTNYERFDIVVLDKSILGTPVIKRVVALPGETLYILEGNLFINDELINDPYNSFEMLDMDAITLKDDEYFVLGDNRAVSQDSRSFGPVSKSDIEGITSLRIFPFNKIENVD